MDVSITWMDMQNDGNNLKTAKNMSRKVRNKPRTQNSSLELKIEMPKCPKEQKHVNIDRNDMYALWNRLIDAQDSQNIMIAMGEQLG